MSMTPFKFEIDQKVTCVVGSKYRSVPQGAPGVVTDTYQSPVTGECVYEVQFGYDTVLVRESDLAAQ